MRNANKSNEYCFKNFGLFEETVELIFFSHYC